MSCVDSIAAEGEAGLIGDVTVSAGDGIVLTQVGQDIEIAVEADDPDVQIELLGDSGLSHGIEVAANASANTKGDFVTIGTTAFEADGFYVQFVPGTEGNRFLVDIAVGGAGSEVVIVPNIYISATGVLSGNFPFASPGFYVPLAVANGTRISARCQSSSAGSDTIWCSVVPIASDLARRMRCTTATTYGADTSDSGGTSVDPGATINTNGTAVQLSASVSQIDYAVVCVNNVTPGANLATASWFLELCVGAAAAETTVIPGIQVRSHDNYDIPAPQISSRYAHWDAATRLSARARCSINTATVRILDVAVIGFS